MQSEEIGELNHFSETFTNLREKQLHEMVVNRRSGENWKIECSCGRFWISHRWHCEECFNDHIPFIPSPEPRLKWWDDASYLRYECDCDNEREYQAYLIASEEEEKRYSETQS